MHVRIHETTILESNDFCHAIVYLNHLRVCSALSSNTTNPLRLLNITRKAAAMAGRECSSGTLLACSSLDRAMLHESFHAHRYLVTYSWLQVMADMSDSELG